MIKKQKIILLLCLMASSNVFATEEASTKEANINNQGAPITVTTVSTQDLEVWQFSEGQIEAINSPMIAAEVGGRIISIAADVGQDVVVGQALAKIDPVDFKLAKDLVSADIDRLKSLIVAQKLQVKRFKTLVTKKSANQSSLDEAQAQLGALKAQLAGARVRFQQAERNRIKSQIVSPINGKVDERKVSEGDYVKVGTPLFHLTTLSHLRVWLPFPESLGVQLKVGLPVTLNSPVAPGQRVVSTITRIRPEITRSSRAINVIIDLENPGDWEPGASVTGKVRVAVHKKTLVVNQASIIRRPAGLVVYLLADGKVQEVPVTTGIHQGGIVEILSGVQAGDQLALDGAAYLTDGVVVEVQADVQITSQSDSEQLEASQ